MSSGGERKSGRQRGWTGARGDREDLGHRLQSSTARGGWGGRGARGPDRGVPTGEVTGEEGEGEGGWGGRLETEKVSGGGKV